MATEIQLENGKKTNFVDLGPEIYFFEYFDNSSGCLFSAAFSYFIYMSMMCKIIIGPQ